MRPAIHLILTIIFIAVIAGAVLLATQGGSSSTAPPRPADAASLNPALKALIEKQLAAVNAAPIDVTHRARLGMVYEANSMIDLAARCYAQAMALEPDQPRWLYLHALAIAKLGDVRQAIAQMKRVTEMQPDFEPAFLRMGLWHLDQGEFADANINFQWASRLAPDDLVVLYCQGELYLKTGREHDIPILLGDRVAQHPDDRFARHLLGTAYVRLGQTEKGNELLAGAGAERPEWHDEWDYQISGFRAAPDAVPR